MKNDDVYVLNKNTRLKTREQRRKQQLINIAMLAIFVTGILGTFAFFKPWANGESSSQDTIDTQESEVLNKETQAMATQIFERVSSLMLLPEEEPILYTIDNAAALIQEQAFFVGSENGDTLLIFPENAKAVIYSESRHIIVNVGPLTYDNEPPATEVTE